MIYPFMGRGDINNGNYNDLTESGCYNIKENVINGPNTYWGTLVVFKCGNNIIQTFYTNVNDTPIYIRKGNISILANLEWKVISLT